MPTRHAECSCGRLSVDIDAEPVRISMCHCVACQRRTGSVFGAQAWFPRDHVAIRGDATVFRRVADSGNAIDFHFCPACGATVYYEAEARADAIAVPVGAFADPGFPSPRVSVYEARKHDWVRVPVDIEHLE